MLIDRTSAPLLTSIGSALRRRLKASSYQFEPAPTPDRRQLLVDLSVIVQRDARTGIQRVVRALLGQLMAYSGPDLAVVPVFAARDHGYCHARRTPDGQLEMTSQHRRVLQPVAVRSGDIFLGLDLAAHLLPQAESDLRRWRSEGVSINLMVYDLLPLHHPEWFPARTVRNFDRWLGVLARQADRCICISRAVAAMLAPALGMRVHGIMPEIVCIPMGADLAASHPSSGLPSNIAEVRDWLRRHRVLLCVGTIEPRKGHEPVLAALEHLWQSRPASDIALLLVGRPGWKTAILQKRLRLHPEQGRRLLWLDQASDELLGELYGSASGLIAASRGEGFGLPLIEALAHGAPVLARDLDVFRETGGPLFEYFDDDAPQMLGERIERWLTGAPRVSAERVAALPRWVDSAGALAAILGLPQRPTSVSATS